MTSEKVTNGPPVSEPGQDPGAGAAPAPGATSDAEQAEAPAPSTDLTPLRMELQRRQQPSSLWTRALVTLGGLAAFVVLGLDSGWASLVVLLGVLALHEAGHFVAMRAFGYRDLRVFLIPMVGAAVAGVPTRTSPWRELVVDLAGPVPGLAAGAALLLWADLDSPVVRDIGLQLVVLNAFNLLPMLPFDGGRVLGLAVEGKNPLWGGALTALSMVGLVAISVWMASGWMGLVAASVLFAYLARDKLVRTAWQLRSTRERWSTSLQDAPDDEVIVLDAACRKLPGSASAAQRAASVEALHRLVSAPPARWTTGLAIVSVYGVVMVASLAAVALTPRASRPDWRRYEPANHAFAVDLPGPPTVRLQQGGSVASAQKGGFLAGVEHFEPAADVDVQVLSLSRLDAGLAAGQPWKLVSSTEEPWRGQPAFQSEYAMGDGSRMRQLYLVRGRTVLRVFARCDGRFAPMAQRVFDGLTLGP